MFSILNRKINIQESPFIIAEMSGNHNGDFELAKRIIEKAAKTGADAIKLQTYTADTLTLNSQNDEFVVEEGIWAGRSLYDLYQEAYTPWEWHAELFRLAKSLGLIAFSSPFDFSAIDFLESINCPAYKIASPELIDIPLIEKVAATGKPVIMSSGMAQKEEIVEAINAYKNAGGGPLALLHCISGYPTPINDVNLNTMLDKSKIHGVEEIGISDHTLGTAVPIAAVALGATIVEKHFCLGKELGGVDSAFSLDPHEFTEMVDACRAAHRALGSINYQTKDSEKQGRKGRRSLYAIKSLTGGSVITEDDIKSVRPGNGLHPRYYNSLIGRTIRRDVQKNEALSWEIFGDEYAGIVKNAAGRVRTIKNNPKIVGISQARMGSSRLPGKTLTNLMGKNVLERHILRVRKSKLIKDYVIATSTNPEDDKIEEFCSSFEQKVFRGSSDDVLKRYLDTAKEYRADVIVRMTADCPLIDPDLIDHVIQYFLQNQGTLDYACLDIRRYARGFDVEVFSRDALERISELADSDYEREHVTLGIYRRPEIFKTAFYYDDQLEYKEEPDRLCVDTSADLEAISTLLEIAGAESENLNWRSILELMEKHPEIRKLNTHIEQIKV